MRSLQPNRLAPCDEIPSRTSENDWTNECQRGQHQAIVPRQPLFFFKAIEVSRKTMPNQRYRRPHPLLFISVHTSSQKSRTTRFTLFPASSQLIPLFREHQENRVLPDTSFSSRSLLSRRNRGAAVGGFRGFVVLQDCVNWFEFERLVVNWLMDGRLHLEFFGRRRIVHTMFGTFILERQGEWSQEEWAVGQP